MSLRDNIFDQDDTFSNFIDQRNPEAVEAEVIYCSFQMQDPGSQLPEEYTEEQCMLKAVGVCLRSLRWRERAMLKKRFGIGGPVMTAQQIGDEYNICAGRVNAILKTAMDKLRLPHRATKLQDFVGANVAGTLKKEKRFKPHPIFGPNPEIFLVTKKV